MHREEIKIKTEYFTATILYNPEVITSEEVLQKVVNAVKHSLEWRKNREQ